MKPRAIIIGIDGADYELMDAWIRAGELPELGQLSTEGALAPLHSTVPPLTPCAWTTMLTGVNPATHGIYDFRQIVLDDTAAPLLLADRCRAATICQLLNADGLSVGLFNVPWTYPPESVHGYVIAGMAPVEDDTISSSPHLVNELRRNFAGYRSWYELEGSTGEAYARGVEHDTERTALIARWLLQEHPVDVFMCVFRAVDIVQHQCSHRPGIASYVGIEDIVLHAYQWVSRAIGELVHDFADEDCLVMVVSDHGFGPRRGAINTARALVDAGLLVTDAEPGRTSLLKPAHALARGVWRGIRKLVPGDLLHGTAVATSRALGGAERVRIRWKQTRIAPWGQYGLLRVNLAGRDPHGIVSRDQYSEVCRQAREALMMLSSPGDGGGAVEDVQEADQAGLGEPLGDGPDLIVIPRGWEYGFSDFVHPRADGTQFTKVSWSALSAPLVDERPISGDHKPDGILILSRRGVVRSGEAPTCHLASVAPTLLWLLGTRIPEHMQGEALVGITEPEFLATHPVRYGPPVPPAGRPVPEGFSSSAEALRDVERRLEDLGYL